MSLGVKQKKEGGPPPLTQGRSADFGFEKMVDANVAARFATSPRARTTRSCRQTATVADLPEPISNRRRPRFRAPVVLGPQGRRRFKRTKGTVEALRGQRRQRQTKSAAAFVPIFAVIRDSSRFLAGMALHRADKGFGSRTTRPDPKISFHPSSEHLVAGSARGEKSGRRILRGPACRIPRNSGV